MKSSPFNMILAIAFLLSLMATAAAASASANPRCNPTTYEPGSDLEANVFTVLESIRTATASTPDRTYTIQLPHVFGASMCISDIDVGDCISCINDSVDAVKDQCDRSIAATISAGDCGMFYNVQ
ncbi:uncharacterized protein LOC109835896 [Asparagus officinalis]|uniref:uncharacterized protein LOC109835896 n=1 Tax=Asparagus officinalis TaxID=4686 RepID=UPI00098E56E4|nr:uncharacterized protein LOC109835896 [Asparagus officinalis]